MKKVISLVLALVMVSMFLISTASAEGVFFHVFEASASYGDEECDYIDATPILTKLHKDAGYMWYALELDLNGMVCFCLRPDGFKFIVKNILKLEDGTIMFPERVDGMEMEDIVVGEEDFYNLVYGE